MKSFIQLLFLLFCPIEAAAKQTITLHHGFAPGYLSDQFQILLDRFHTQHPEFEVRPTSQGDYLQGFQAAFDGVQGKRLPADLYLVSEFGSPTLVAMQRKSPVFLPVSELLPELASLSYPAGMDMAYGDKGVLYALPFNPAMGILYYNLDAFQACKLPSPKEHPLHTWEEVFAASRQLHKCGFTGFTFPWTAAYTYEHLASIHQQHIATEHNGFLDMEKAKFDFSAPLFATFFQQFFEAQENGSFHYVSEWAGDVETFFAQKTCGILMDGAGRKSIIEELLKKSPGAPMQLAFGPLPYLASHQTKGQVLGVPKIGGSALWVHRATPHRAGVAALLRFFVAPTNQQFWVEKTGYLPITMQGYQLLNTSQFYQREVYAAAAVEQFLRPTFGTFTHVRMLSYGEIRGELFNSLLQTYFKRKDLPAAKKASEFLREFSSKANERLHTAVTKSKL